MEAPVTLRCHEGQVRLEEADGEEEGGLGRGGRGPEASRRLGARRLCVNVVEAAFGAVSLDLGDLRLEKGDVGDSGVAGSASAGPPAKLAPRSRSSARG